MIRNERQYIITKSQVKKFKKALDDFTKQGLSTHPMLVKAQKEGMESQLAELEGSVKEY